MKLYRKIFASLPLAGAIVVAYPSPWARGASSPAGIPCAARADAVVANSGSVSSNSNSLVDSYQSSLGAYGGANVGSNGSVQAATSIFANGGVVHGTETQHTPGGLAPVPVPAGATNLGSVNINNAAQSITLAPGNYVATNINVNSPGAIKISPAGQVLIWVTGSVNLGGDENLNGVPENLQFLLTSSASVSVNTNGRLFGFLYAPLSSVNVNSTIFGGVVGSTVTLNSGSAVHFDANSTCPVVRKPEAVAAGFHFACGIDAAGGAECWGQNNFGQLGNGSTTNSAVPSQVTGLTSGVVSIATGTVSACAVTSAGAVECWGENATGELGNGTTNNSSVPVPVTGLTSGATAVTVGDHSACALTAGGGVMCWGLNVNGDLGNGTTTTSAVPVQVTGLTSGITAVSAGGATKCALTAGGGVLCWGNGDFGGLGNGDVENSLVPTQVTGLTSGVTSISVGLETSCAVTSTGSAMCWGNFPGDGTSNNDVPVQVSGLTSGVTAISAGDGATCAVASGGALECWGQNTSGQLGDNSTTMSLVPVPVTGLTSGVVATAVGDSFACALVASGGLECWGDNSSGELGDNSAASSLVPVPVVGFP